MVRSADLDKTSTNTSTTSDHFFSFFLLLLFLRAALAFNIRCFNIWASLCAQSVPDLCQGLVQDVTVIALEMGRDCIYPAIENLVAVLSWEKSDRKTPEEVTSGTQNRTRHFHQVHVVNVLYHVTPCEFRPRAARHDSAFLNQSQEPEDRVELLGLTSSPGQCEFTTCYIMTSLLS